MKTPGDSSLWALAEAAEKEVSTWPNWKRRAADTALVTRPSDTRKTPGECLYYREYPGGFEPGIRWEELPFVVREHFVRKAKKDHTLVEPPELGGPVEIADVPLKYNDKECLHQAMTHLLKALGWLNRTSGETRSLHVTADGAFGEIRKVDPKARDEAKETS